MSNEDGIKYQSGNLENFIKKNLTPEIIISDKKKSKIINPAGGNEISQIQKAIHFSASPEKQQKHPIILSIENAILAADQNALLVAIKILNDFLLPARKNNIKEGSFSPTRSEGIKDQVEKFIKNCEWYPKNNYNLTFTLSDGVTDIKITFNNEKISITLKEEHAGIEAKKNWEIINQ